MRGIGAATACTLAQHGAAVAFLTTVLRRGATVQTAQLFLENVWRRSLLMLSITGKDFAPQEVVTVRLSWHGTPAAAATPRYTTYTTPSSALIRRGGS